MKNLLIKLDDNGDLGSLFWTLSFHDSKGKPYFQRVQLADLPYEKIERLGRYLKSAEGEYALYGESAGHLANLIAEDLTEIRPFLNNFKHVELELPKEFTEAMSLNTNIFPLNDFIELVRGSECWKAVMHQHL